MLIRYNISIQGYVFQWLSVPHREFPNENILFLKKDDKDQEQVKKEIIDKWYNKLNDEKRKYSWLFKFNIGKTNDPTSWRIYLNKSLIFFYALICSLLWIYVYFSQIIK